MIFLEQLLVFIYLYLLHLAFQSVMARMSDLEFCELLHSETASITVIGLVHNRFVCVLYTRDPRAQPSPYQLYLVPSSALDSNGKKVFLYDGTPMAQTWSDLSQLLVANQYDSQIITVQDSTTDYVFVHNVIYSATDSKSILFAVDSNKLRETPELSVNYSDVSWISSVEEMSFYGIKKIKNDAQIAKFVFNGSKVMSEVSTITQVTAYYSICMSSEGNADNSDNWQILIKDGKCNHPVKDWKVVASFSDQDRFYIILDASKPNNQSRQVVIFDKSALDTNLGNPINVENVLLNEFFICGNPPEPTDQIKIIPTKGSSAVTVVIIIFGTVLGLALISIGLCCCTKPKEDELNRPKRRLPPPAPKVQASNQTAMNTVDNATLGQSTQAIDAGNSGQQTNIAPLMHQPTKVVPHGPKKAAKKNHSKNKMSSSGNKSMNTNKNRKKVSKHSSANSSSNGKSARGSKRNSKKGSSRKNTSRIANKNPNYKSDRRKSANQNTKKR